MLTVALPIAVALALCGTAILLTLALIGRARRGEEPSPAAAAIVFGAAVHDGRPCPELRARLERAAELFAAGLTARVVCSGGPDEVAAMRGHLVALGVPSEAVLEDPGGTSTRATIARAGGLGSVLLVSSPWHGRRIRSEALRQALHHSFCPPMRSPVEGCPRSRRRQLAREVIAIWWYALSRPPWRLARRPPARLSGEIRSESTG